MNDFFFGGFLLDRKRSDQRRNRRNRNVRLLRNPRTNCRQNRGGHKKVLRLLGGRDGAGAAVRRGDRHSGAEHWGGGHLQYLLS